MLARAPQFDESLTLCTVDLQAAATARLRDTRLRPPVRRALPEVRRLGPLERTPARARDARRRGRAAARARGRGLRRARAWACATTCARTASSTSCSASRAGSTRRSSLLIAADALGAERVTAVVMPSRYSSEGTQSDARELAANLGIQCLDHPDRARDGGLRADAAPRSSAVPSPTSPRRTSRRGSAATC